MGYVLIQTTLGYRAIWILRTRSSYYIIWGLDSQLFTRVFFWQPRWLSLHFFYIYPSLCIRTAMWLRNQSQMHFMSLGNHFALTSKDLVGKGLSSGDFKPPCKSLSKPSPPNSFCFSCSLAGDGTNRFWELSNTASALILAGANIKIRAMTAKVSLFEFGAQWIS